MTHFVAVVQPSPVLRVLIIAIPFYPEDDARCYEQLLNFYPLLQITEHDLVFLYILFCKLFVPLFLLQKALVYASGVNLMVESVQKGHYPLVQAFSWLVFAILTVFRAGQRHL